MGGSSGVNVAGAMRLARHLGQGKTIVTILCDNGMRYQSKLYNPDFLRSKGLPVPAWLERKASVEVPFEGGLTRAASSNNGTLAPRPVSPTPPHQ